MTSSLICRGASYAAALLLLFGGVGAPRAEVQDDPGWRPSGVYLQAGRAEDETRVWIGGVQWHWAAHWCPSPGWVVSGYTEVSAGRWQIQPGNAESASAWITQLSATPILRLGSALRRGGYVEAGIGPSYLVPLYQTHRRRFSTQFNFRDQIGSGYVWGAAGEHDVSVRVEHYSNAGIRRPNPGVNLWSLRYAHRF